MSLDISFELHESGPVVSCSHREMRNDGIEPSRVGRVLGELALQRLGDRDEWL
jgi:hypothetical protein